MYETLDGTARARRDDGDERCLGDLMFLTLVESVLGVPAPGPDDTAGNTGGDTAAGATPAACGGGGVGVGGLSQHDLDPYDDALDTYPTDQPPPPTTPARARVRRRSPVTVEAQIVIGAGTLLGLDDAPVLLRGYGAIPAEIARQIADGGGGAGGEVSESTRLMLRRLICDPLDGRLLAMESTTRCYLGGLREFAIYRDQNCRLSGGRIRHIDHILAVADDGPTTAANAQGLTLNSHVLKDHPGHPRHRRRHCRPAARRPRRRPSRRRCHGRCDRRRLGSRAAPGRTARELARCHLDDAHRSLLPVPPTTSTRPRHQTLRRRRATPTTPAAGRHRPARHRDPHHRPSTRPTTPLGQT